jgi:hypothetical protein
MQGADRPFDTDIHKRVSAGLPDLPVNAFIRIFPFLYARGNFIWMVVG